MNYQTTNIKLFAWALLIKGVRVTSVLYNDESPGKFIKRSNLTISERTYRKYLNMARDLGLVKPHGPHEQLIDWEMFMKVLGIDTDTNFFNQIFNRKTHKIRSFKDMCDWVYFCLFAQSFHKQEVAIEKANRKRAIAEVLLKSLGKKTLGNRHYVKELKKLSKSAAKLNITVEEYAHLVLNDKKFNNTIVTGSKSLSYKFGLSQKTANNKLNKMSKAGYISRDVVKSFHKLEGGNVDLAVDILRGQGHAAFACSNKKGYFEVLGSRISLSPILSVKTAGNPSPLLLASN